MSLLIDIEQLEPFTTGDGDGIYSGSGTVPSSTVVTLTDTLAINDGTIVFNENGAAVDFRVEGDTDPNLLFIDGSTDRVGIGTNTPNVKFELKGSAVSAEVLRITDGSNVAHLRVNEAGHIGINQAPSYGVNGTGLGMLWNDGNTRYGMGITMAAGSAFTGGGVFSGARIVIESQGGQTAQGLYIDADNAAGGSAYAIFSDRGHNYFNVSGEDYNFRVSTLGDTNALYIDGGTDEVGIGTSNPGSKLHILGGSSSGDYALRVDAGGGFGADGLVVQRQSSGLPWVGIGTDTQGAGNPILDVDGTTRMQGSLLMGGASATANHIRMPSGWTVRIGNYQLRDTDGFEFIADLFKFKATGGNETMLEINRNSPEAQLIGRARDAGVSTTIQRHSLRQQSTYWDGAAAQVLTTDIRNNPTDTAGNYNLEFIVNGSERLVIDQDGNVGLGTTSPAEKFHVSGGDVLMEHTDVTADFNLTLTPGDANAANLIKDANLFLGAKYWDGASSVAVNDARIRHWMRDDSPVLHYLQLANNASVTSISIDQDGHTAVGAQFSASALDVYGISGDTFAMRVNPNGADFDFSVDSANVPNILYTNGGTDRVGIGTSTPIAKLDIRGGLAVNAQNADEDTQIGSVTFDDMFLVDAFEDAIGIGGVSPGSTNKLYLLTSDKDNAIRIDQSYTGAAALKGIILNISGVGGSSETNGIDLNISTSGGTNTYGINIEGGPSATNNYGVRSLMTGAGTQNYGVIGGASGASNLNFGLAGVAGSTFPSTTATDAGVVAQIKGSRDGGRALWIYNLSSTTGTSYGYYIQDFGGDAAATTYGGWIELDRAVDRNIGLYIRTSGAGTENTAIITQTGGIIFNEGGDPDSDLRVEGDTDINLLFIDASADAIGIGTDSPTAKLDVNGSTGYDQLRLRTNYTPTGTADANGNTGDFAWDDNFVYVKTSAGWKRSALSTF